MEVQDAGGGYVGEKGGEIFFVVIGGWEALEFVVETLCLRCRDDRILSLVD